MDSSISYHVSNRCVSALTECYRDPACISERDRNKGHVTPIDHAVEATFTDLERWITHHKLLLRAVERYLKNGPLGTAKQYIYQTADRSKKSKKQLVNEKLLLGNEMIWAGRSLEKFDRGLYGMVLVNVGLAEWDLGHEEMKFVSLVAMNYLLPLGNFLTDFLRPALKERQLLLSRRADMDAVHVNAHDKEDSTKSRKQQRRHLRHETAQRDFNDQLLEAKVTCSRIEEEKRRILMSLLRFVECQLQYMQNNVIVMSALRNSLARRLEPEYSALLKWPKIPDSPAGKILKHNDQGTRNELLPGDAFVVSGADSDIHLPPPFSPLIQSFPQIVRPHELHERDGFDRLLQQAKTAHHSPSNASLSPSTEQSEFDSYATGSAQTQGDTVEHSTSHRTVDSQSSFHDQPPKRSSNFLRKFLPSTWVSSPAILHNEQGLIEQVMKPVHVVRRTWGAVKSVVSLSKQRLESGARRGTIAENEMTLFSVMESLRKSGAATD